MADFYLLDNPAQQTLQRIQFKGDVKSLDVDCSPWADDNGTVTTATWSVESGSASIGTEALASNVASMLLTTSVADSGVIKLVVTDGTHSEALYINYIVKDPQAYPTDDYWNR